MLGKRRVFDLTNTITDYLFSLFILLSALFASSQWIPMKREFTGFIASVLVSLGLVITALCLAMVLLAIALAVQEKGFRAWPLVWCIVRMAVSMTFSLLVNALTVTMSGGLHLSL